MKVPKKRETAILKGKRVKAMKIAGIAFVIAVVMLLFIGNRIAKGIGDSLENGIKGVHKVYRSMDSTNFAKIDSLKEDVAQDIDSGAAVKNKVSDSIECSINGCEGFYSGPEFVYGSDIAHQFSNKMAEKVGKKLKELYAEMKYHKVDFSKIEISTEGMGSGSVVYRIKIPFEKVKEKCDAYTSFDHVGGWNHTPALARRKIELKDVLIEGEKLYISDLKTTPEGLQEYWIQWRNKNIQSECK